MRWALLMVVALGACGDDGGSMATPDAAKQVDAPKPAAGTRHGCADADYVDRTGAGADRMIGMTGTGFAPKCIAIAVGQSVTIYGEFDTHPLEPGRAPTYADDPAPTEPTPFVATSTGNTADFGPFTAPGYYPYYCSLHETLGMIGVVHVVP